MSGFQVDPIAAGQIDEIYDYTRHRWGANQAERYIHGLVERFTRLLIASLSGDRFRLSSASPATSTDMDGATSIGSELRMVSFGSSRSSR
ncbi:MAG: type II toxin-antitoxin system RelE/ParE family toxin [Sphingomonas sp.]|nr:type II toxin-antitoxin system RelE/ParE family toxin [Sphingomonas sp.]